MMVSTRGRYALRVLLDLAEADPQTYTPLKDIAARQGISQKYLESIMTVLSKAELIDAVHGKGGGYRLRRPPRDYPIGEILRLTEGSLAPVACLDCSAEPCEKASLCRTRPMWNELNGLILDFLDSRSLADLLPPQG